LTGFLYGWTLFTVIQSGTIAAVAVAFARFSAVFWPQISSEPTIPGISSQQVLAILIVALLSVFNFGKVKNSAILQNTFTFGKIAALLFMFGAGLWYVLNHAPKHPIDWNPIPQGFSFSWMSLLAVAMTGSLFSADAWNNITFTAGEIRKPERNLPLALIIGTGTVLSIYFLINLMYVHVLPFEAIQNAPSDRVGTAFLHAILGDTGLFLMAGLIMLSTFGCLNGIILSSARVYYAMAQDGLFFKGAAQLNRHGSPRFALIIQMVWASLLTLSGSYSDLLNYVMLAVLLFYIITIFALFKLRSTKPDMPRPYRAIGYPIVPILYITLAGFVCLSLLILKPEYTWPGLGIVVAGTPVYFWLVKKNQPR
jgi:APA family basic amino acid/polyamine antiporter